MVHLIMALLPATRCFALKRRMLRWCGANIGPGVRIASSVHILMSGDLSIGEDTWIGHDVLIVGGNASVTIGSRVDIAPRVTFVTGTHEIDRGGRRIAGAGASSPIVVRDGAWIGASATVLGGVTVGEMSVVGAGALVNRDVPHSSMAAGVPARVMVEAF